jgi:hypothetical protein
VQNGIGMAVHVTLVQKFASFKKMLNGAAVGAACDTGAKY